MIAKKVALNTAIVLGILTLAFLLWEFREAVILFIFSLAVAAAARPYVEALVIRRVPRAIAIVLTYVIFILLLVLIFWAIGSSFLNEIQLLSNRLAITYETIWKTWPKGSDVQQFIIHQLPDPQVFYKSLTPEHADTAISKLLGFTITYATLSGQIFTILMLSIYWSIDRVHFERLWLSLLPVDSRARARDIWRNIEHDFGAYVRSEVLQSIIAGLLIGLGLWAMGIQYPTLLALFAAVAWLIPWLGGVLALLPIALIGLSQSLGMGIFASIFALGVLFFLEFFIEPRFVRRRTQQFSPLLSILLIIALVRPFGLMGFLVAPPLAAAVELVFRYNLRNRPLPESVQSAEQIAVLRGRIIQIREMLARGPDEAEPQTSSLLARLESLVDESDRAIRAGQSSAPRRPMRRSTDQLPAEHVRRS